MPLACSAEIRWFFHGPEAPPFRNWFCAAGPGYGAAGGGHHQGRTDEYLRDPGQTQLGIKARGGGKGIELKTLVAVSRTHLGIPPFAGPIEIWTKASSTVLQLDPGLLVKVHKRRWIRKFDTAASPPVELDLDAEENLVGGGSLPNDGCNVELTQVSVEGAADTWWTFGFEAFGPLWNVESSLLATAALLAGRNPSGWTEGRLASYPAWLALVLR